MQLEKKILSLEHIEYLEWLLKQVLDPDEIEEKKKSFELQYLTRITRLKEDYHVDTWFDIYEKIQKKIIVVYDQTIIGGFESWE